MLKSVVMAYHFIGPDGPTDSLSSNGCFEAGYKVTEELKR